MLTEQRYEQILKLLEKEGSITVTEVKRTSEYIGIDRAKRYHSAS